MATSTLGSGTLVLAGTTSGTTTVTATAVAGTTTLTLPAATDTLVGKATTDTLTNKTLTSPTLTGVVTFDAGTAAAPAITTTGDTNTGIFFPAADTIAFAEGGAEAMRLDSAGNMGLGVTPSAWSGSSKAIQVQRGTLNSYANLDLQLGQNYYYDGTNNKYVANGYATYYSQYNGSHIWTTAPSGTAGNNISFTQAMTLDASGNLGVGTTSPTNVSNYKGITLNGTTGGLVDLASNGTVGLRLQCDTTYPGGALFTLTNQPMVFGTNGTERARIDSSGNLLVGKTSNVVTTAGVNIFPTGDIYSVGAGSTDFDNMRFYRNGSASSVGRITTTSTTTSYVTSSDYRLKEDITPMTGALAKVAALKPVSYKWKSDGSDSQGFIAHELQAVVPECVTGEKDAVDADGKPQYQGIDTSFLVATLTAAIQEQQALITTLTARITALESA